MNARDMLIVIIVIIAVFVWALMVAGAMHLAKIIGKRRGATNPAPDWMAEAERNGDIHDQ